MKKIYEATEEDEVKESDKKLEQKRDLLKERLKRRVSRGCPYTEQSLYKGAQWLSGRVLESRRRGRGSEPHRHHCVVSLSKNINPSFVLVQTRKNRPFITKD